MAKFCPQENRGMSLGRSCWLRRRRQKLDFWARRLPPKDPKGRSQWVSTGKILITRAKNVTMVIAAAQMTREEVAPRRRGRKRAPAAATAAMKAKAKAWASAKITITTIGTSIKGSTVLTKDTRVV